MPLVFVKRLSDVFEDEINRLSYEFGDKEIALAVVEEDHSLVRFFLPRDARWSKIRKLTAEVGQNLTDKMRMITGENPSLQGIIDIVDYNATYSGQRIVDDDRLSALIEILSDRQQGISCYLGYMDFTN